MEEVEYGDKTGSIKFTWLIVGLVDFFCTGEVMLTGNNQYGIARK